MAGPAWRAGAPCGPGGGLWRGRRGGKGLAVEVRAGKKYHTVKVDRQELARQAKRVRRERAMVPARRGNSGAYVAEAIRPRREKVDVPRPGEQVLESAEAVLSMAADAWEDLPSRYRVVAASSLAFVLCNLDKVNMSVAIIPMARQFGWGASVAGLVQSGFFWGYILSQLPGGYLCGRFSGRKVLPVGVGLWALATASVPGVAASLPGLCLSRASVGLGEAVAPSAITDMVAHCVPSGERSRAISFIFGGLHVGSILGLLLAPVLIEHFGWQSVFLVSGAAAVTWVVWWERLVADMAATDPEVHGLITQTTTVRTDGQAAAKGDPAAKGDLADAHVPWRAILRSQPVQALMFTHFCNNWFQYTFMAWLPSYLTDTLSLDLVHAAQVALLPPIAGILTSSVAGPMADFLVERGWETSVVRKLAQCMAFLGPAACLTAATLTEDSVLRVGLITTALGLSSFSMAGLYCNHQDLSPKYASFLLGLTNTTGAVPGIFGVFFVGFLLDQTGSWPIALFIPSILSFIAGTFVFTKYASSEQELFDNDQPFELERRLGALLPWTE
ncbi:unnamed protein product [Ostreobium quekettii]|uniref:Major facilitator superfamily (MFS) profile domain-containing protein n=1 Tax=Ostreobium quekettii TaxID=121088 RepID=A0A8S1IYP6_9CHLO|nr:unnamed protein product [Ostreobium quekettii]